MWSGLSDSFNLNIFKKIKFNSDESWEDFNASWCIQVTDLHVKFKLPPSRPSVLKEFENVQRKRLETNE